MSDTVSVPFWNRSTLSKPALCLEEIAIFHSTRVCSPALIFDGVGVPDLCMRVCVLATGVTGHVSSSQIFALSFVRWGTADIVEWAGWATEGMRDVSAFGLFTATA